MNSKLTNATFMSTGSYISFKKAYFYFMSVIFIHLCLKLVSRHHVMKNIIKLYIRILTRKGCWTCCKVKLK